MAQFDVHALPDGTWVVDVQADALVIRDSCVIVPLVAPVDTVAPLRGLTPAILVDGEERLFAAHLITVVRRRSLTPVNVSLTSERLTIQAALDLLFNGH